MPRYIDADLEVSKYVTVWDCDCSEFGKQTVMAVDDLHYLPTANVMTRAEAGFYIEQARQEVAREIFEEVGREITDSLNSNCKVLPQVEESEALWNNVNGKINALSGIRYFIDELKKKYTEESSNE